ncbi:MAG: FAD-dependent oxidoreductase [Desulfosarcina sp.]
MHLVIVGGDAAGMSAASRVKRNRPEISVTVLEMTTDVSYSACGMPYNIADADRDMGDLVVRAADAFRHKQGINLLTGYQVESIQTEKRTVLGTMQHNHASFRFSYDQLLIATGGRPVIPQLPGIDLPGVLALKSLESGRQVKAFIRNQPVKQAVIIGMGYLGMEMAEALRTRGIAVAMVKPGPDLLPWMPRELAAVVQQELLDHQVAHFIGVWARLGPFRHRSPERSGRVERLDRRLPSRNFGVPRRAVISPVAM